VDADAGVEPDDAGPGGDDVILVPAPCGDPSAAPGCLPLVHGAAGEVVRTSLCIASPSDPGGPVAMVGGVFTYDADRAALDGLEAVVCFSTGSCVQVEASSPGSFPYESGYSIATSPSPLAQASGTTAFLLVNLWSPSAPFGDPQVDPSGDLVLATSVTLDVVLTLAEDVAPASPVEICLVEPRAAAASGQALAVEVDGARVVASDPLPTPPGTQLGCPPVLGDLTGNGVVTATDINCAKANVVAALAGAPDPGCDSGAPNITDPDCSGAVDLLDVFVVVLAAASKPLPGTLDGDASACPDRCE
jgi:hypothetical protein